MKKSILLIALLLIPLIAVSGCIGGSDENIDAWNEHVDAANAHIIEGNDAKDEGNSAANQEQYDLALTKFDSAIDHYQAAKTEVGALDPVARDLDKDYLSDYVDLWEDEIDAFIEQISYNNKMIYALKFGEHYDSFFTTFSTAYQQYSDAVYYFNDGNYQATTTTATLSQEKWDDLLLTAESMHELSQKIDVAYVKQYTAYLVSMCDNANKSLGFLKEAAYAAGQGNWQAANNYLTEQNNHDATLTSNIDSIITLESTHPAAFPETGQALAPLIDEFVAKRDAAYEDAQGYAEERAQIEEDHDDFFE